MIALGDCVRVHLEIIPITLATIRQRLSLTCNRLRYSVCIFPVVINFPGDVSAPGRYI